MQCWDATGHLGFPSMCSHLLRIRDCDLAFSSDTAGRAYWLAYLSSEPAQYRGWRSQLPSCCQGRSGDSSDRENFRLLSVSVALQLTVFGHRVVLCVLETGVVADANRAGLGSDDSGSYHIHSSSAMCGNEHVSEWAITES